MKKLTSRITTNITMNASILFAAIGVAVAIVAEHVATEIKLPPFVSMILIGVILITVVYALFQLIQQWFATRSEAAKAPGVYRSAITGSFLLCLVSLILTDNSIPGLRLVVAGIALCVMAFLAFLVITWFSFDDTTMAGTSFDPKDVLPPIEPFYVDQDTPKVRKSGQLPQNKQTVDPGTLPPLFEQDPLYILPQLSGTRTRFFSIAKGNNPLVYSSDACAVSSDESSFTLCDGISSWPFSRPWGTLLGMQWNVLSDKNANNFVAHLAWARQEWKRWLLETWKPQVNQRNYQTRQPALSDKEVNQWLQAGASSTFLGFKLYDKKKWLATALGDTCLFIVQVDKKNQIKSIVSFPLTEPSHFGESSPSFNSVRDTMLPSFQNGTIGRGHTIFLMATRPLAQWMLVQRTQDLQALLAVRDKEHFAGFINRQRYNQTNPMIDDDTTLLIIDLEA